MKNRILFIAFALLACQIPIRTNGQGFPNVPQVPGTLLSGGLLAPNQGRTAIIAYHNGWLFTIPEHPSSMPGSDYQGRRWNISDPSNAQVMETLGISGSSTSAHGYHKLGDYLMLGGNGFDFIDSNTGEHIVGLSYVWRAIAPGVNERTTYPVQHPIYSRGDLYRPYYTSMFWSYSELDETAVLGHGTQQLAEWDHLGLTGVIGHPFIVGNLLIFASDQSRTGVATYDISDPSNPVLLDVLTDGGPGGYWPELWGGDGQLLIVFPYRTGGNGIRVVDVTDPSHIRFLTDVSLPGASCMYAQFQDDYLFTGSHKVDMRTFSSVLSLDLDPFELDTSQFALPLGNLLVTGGAGPGQGMAIWAHDAEPDTTGPSVGFHIPRAGQTNYPTTAPISLLIHETLESPTMINGQTFIVRPQGGSPVEGLIRWTFNDSLTFTPDEPLLPNTTYEVVVPEGGITDAAGNGIEGYAFSFSTGDTVSGNQPPTISSLDASHYPVTPGQSLSLNATASDPNGDSVEYRFDFGDGTDRTAWNPLPSTSHTYDTPGHYRAVVQVRDSQGSLASRMTTITVTDAIASATPPRSTPIALDEANRRLWIVNPDNNSVTLLDADTEAILEETSVGSDPRSVAIDANGYAWVTCHDADQIDLLDPSGTLIDSLPLDYGSAPFGIVIHPAGHSAFVSMQGSGEVVRYSTVTRTQTGTLTLGPTARALALTPTGDQLFVSRLISPAHRGEIWEVDTASMTLSRLLEIEKFGGNLHRDGTAEGMGVANYLTGLAVSPDGSTLLVTSNKMNTDKGLLSGPDLDHDNTVRNLVSRFDVTSGQFLGATDIDNSDSAHAVTFSPLGDYLFVMLQGNDALLVLDNLALSETAGLGGLVTRRSVGSAPQGVVFDTASNQLWVKNFLSRSVSRLDIGALLETGQVSFPRADVDTVSSETLPATVLEGKRLFYHAGPQMSGEGYISCATCHLDGSEDGRVWDFTGRGEGLRNTITLRGRSGTGHGAVHWSANFDEIQDFEHDIRGFFGGDGFLSDEQFATTSPLGIPKAGLSTELDALAAYVSSLGHESLARSPHRSETGTLDAAGAAGRIIFNTLDCRTCHTGPELIDGNLHNVGTLRGSSGNRLGGLLEGIETPTLRGIWNTAPYLHDGSAETLEDVFSATGGDHYPAEAGSLQAPAIIYDGDNVTNNFDDTARDGAFVVLPGTGNLTLSNLDGGSGGTGVIEFRYTFGDAPYPLRVTLNGIEQLINLPPVQNGIPWRFVNWRTYRIENVELTPGPTNTISFSGTNEYFNVYIDEVVVATPEMLAQAQPHRQVLGLTSQDRGNLMAYLRQLDGSPIDTSPPTPAVATLTASGAETTITSNPITLELQFDRGMMGLDASDFVLGGTAIPQTLNVIPIENGMHYQLSVAGMQLPGTVTVQLPANSAHDFGGLGNADSGILTLNWDAFVDDLAPLGDEFNNANSITQWNRLNDTEGWNADKLETFDIDTTTPGHMRIMPYTTSWFMDLTGPLVYKEITGDFAVTMELDVQRRNGLSGRPQRQFSLGGIMIRTPRAITAAAPTPNAPAQDQLPWPPNGYTTEWSPDSENYIFLSVGTSDNTGPDDIWNYEVKTTINGNSTLYYGREGVPSGTGRVTLQAVRRGDTFVLLRRHEGGEWIVENRYHRPDMPATLQVGITTYTDWDNIISNGLYTNSEDHSRQYHHNRNVLTAANGFAANPDLIVDIDYVRYTRPRVELSEAELAALPVSAQGPLQWLANTPMAQQLGDALNTVTPDPAFPVQVEWPGPVSGDATIVATVFFPQFSTELTLEDLSIGGSAQPQQVQLLELIPGWAYQITIDGMLATGDVTLQLGAGAVTGADGRSSAATSVYTTNWTLPFVDDLAPLSDEFTDSSQFLNWLRLNDIEGWNADKLEAIDSNTTVANHLHLKPHSSSWYMDLVGPLTFKEITGNFIVTMHVDTRRRGGQSGRPHSYFSLAGIMLRAPRDIVAAGPDINAPSYQRLPWPPSSYSSDWTPNGENYLFYAFGHSIGYAENQWNLQVKNTTNSQSELYHSAIGVPADSGMVTLQAVRIDDTFLLLRRHPGGNWIIENRYQRSDLPETLQVGIAAYTDWSAIAGNGLFTGPEDHESQYHHNRNVIHWDNGFGANPDLEANVDYVRFARPQGLRATDLANAPLTGPTGVVQWLEGNGIGGYLGDAAHSGTTNAAQQLSLGPLPNAPAVNLQPEIRVHHDAATGNIRFQVHLPRGWGDTAGTPFLYTTDLVRWQSMEGFQGSRSTLEKTPGGTQHSLEIPANALEHCFIKVAEPIVAHR